MARGKGEKCPTKTSVRNLPKRKKGEQLIVKLRGPDGTMESMSAPRKPRDTVPPAVKRVVPSSRSNTKARVGSRNRTQASKTNMGYDTKFSAKKMQAHAALLVGHNDGAVDPSSTATRIETQNQKKAKKKTKRGQPKGAGSGGKTMAKGKRKSKGKGKAEEKEEDDEAMKALRQAADKERTTKLGEEWDATHRNEVDTELARRLGKLGTTEIKYDGHSSDCDGGDEPESETDLTEEEHLAEEDKRETKMSVTLFCPGRYNLCGLCVLCG